MYHDQTEQNWIVAPHICTWILTLQNSNFYAHWFTAVKIWAPDNV